MREYLRRCLMSEGFVGLIAVLVWVVAFAVAMTKNIGLPLSIAVGSLTATAWLLLAIAMVMAL